MRLSRLLIPLLLSGTMPLSIARAQQSSSPSPTTVTGRVRAADGRALSGAVVAILETLEETHTGSDGHFALTSTHRGVTTLVARAVGFIPSTIDVVLPTDSVFAFRLVPRPATLTEFVVMAAGEYTIGSGQTASLKPLEVAQTPGAAANIARAIQTLPGAQNVDEGTGLFVRGGDVTETRVLLDDAWMLSPVRFDNPTGHTTPTVNPFLLDRTVFSSGGFGVPYGNALSGLVRMESAASPTRQSASLSASIGGVSAAYGARVHPRVGVRASAGLNSLAALTAAFGEAQPYEPPPRSGDVSGSIEWQSGASGRIRLFGVRQGGVFGVGQANAAGSSHYGARSTDGLAVLTWRDSSTRWRPAMTMAYATFDRRETFGTFQLRTRLSAPQLLASLGYITDDGTRWRVGVEHEALSAGYVGRIEGATGDLAPLFTDHTPSTRLGAFVEGSRRFAAGFHATLGLRSDHSSLTARRTYDPRASLAWQHGSLALTAAWGVYHQVAEPTFRRATPASDFHPMRVQQFIGGVQWGADSLGLRIEYFTKHYAALWQLAERQNPVGGGIGRANGIDVMWRWRLAPSTSTRLTYSHVRSRRTDPQTGLMARSTADVTHSFTWIGEHVYRSLTVGTAVRYATGRPFTDIVGTIPGAGGSSPVLGDPFAARMPVYVRNDVSLSWYRALGERRGLVLWTSLSNVFGRENVMRYRWSEDYTERFPVRAPFNRSIFIGTTLLL
jgi:hypothetical protein